MAIKYVILPTVDIILILILSSTDSDIIVETCIQCSYNKKNCLSAFFRAITESAWEEGCQEEESRITERQRAIAYCTNRTAPEEAVSLCKCEETAHSYCAGVSMKQFSNITESSPYTCARCLKATYLEAISVIKDTIAALQLEVSELRSALSILSSKQCEQESQSAVSQTNCGTSESWADVASHSNGRPNRQQKNGNSSRRAAREVTGQRNTAENCHSGSEI